jgi:hypothetical protein
MSRERHQSAGPVAFQEAHDLVGAQHDRQLARLARTGDALWHRVLAERYAIEEPQRADDLIERRP